MAYRNLDEFLVRLEQAGELLHISHTVRSDLEIAQICQEYAHSNQNKALWFDSVAGSGFPVVTNLFATPQRLAWALGLEDLSDITQRLERLLNFQPPLTLSTIMSRAGELFSLLRSTNTIHQKEIPVQQVRQTENPNLMILPVVHQWADEPYSSMSFAQITMQDAETKNRTVSSGQIIVYDKKTLGIPYHPRYERSTHLVGAIILGGDPAVTWSASVPLPAMIDSYWLAGWLRGKPVPLARAISQNIQVPADAEIVIEGWMDPSERQSHSSFAGNDGYYTDLQQYITFHVTAITHRKHAVFPAAIMMPPPSDHQVILMAYERLFAPLLRLILEDIADIHFPAEGSLYDLAIVSVKNHYEGMAQKIMFGLWGIGEFALNRALIIVDTDVNIHDANTVAGTVLTNVDWEQDVTRVSGLSQQYNQTGTKIGIDATRKSDRQSHETPPADAERITEIVGSQWIIWKDAVLIAVTPDVCFSQRDILDQLWLVCPQYHLIITDEDINLHNPSQVAQFLLVNVDWSSDLTIRSKKAALRVTRRRKPLEISTLSTEADH